jgi:hypothetical protein
MTRTLTQLAFILLLAALPVAAWMPQTAHSQQPAPAAQPAVAVVNALVEVLAAGTDTAARDFIAQHTTPEYRAATPLDAQMAELQRMQRAIGSAEVVSQQGSPWGERTVLLRSVASGAQWVLRLEMESGPPPLVGGIRWREEVLTGALTPRLRAEVLEALIESVERIYVSPDTAALVAVHLRARAATGAYDLLTDRGALAEALTHDLQAISGDGHLSVRDASSELVALGAGVPAQAPASDYGPASLGFTRVERLPGNVGYIEIATALMGPPGRAAEDRALVGEVVRQMEGADAVIIDLRENPGGSALLANHLYSHFLPAGVHLFTVESRLMGTSSERRVAAEVPGPRLLSVPLYVLTSGRTFSAGEDIAFSLASQGRATVVGEPTGGGGRNNTNVPVAHGMWASISFTRVIDPRTGGEAWERVGVPPDVAVPAADALQAALQHAGK